MRVNVFTGIVALGLAGQCLTGCTGATGSDPVAAASNNSNITIAPAATQGPEAGAAAQEELMRKQEAADRKAGRGR